MKYFYFRHTSQHMKLTRSITLFVLYGWLLSACTNNDINKAFDCNTTDLTIALVSKVDATGCKAIDGSLVVAGSLGKAPYDYSLNGGIFQTNPQFGSLGAGTYSVEVKDANGCKKSIDVVIDAANATLNANVVITPRTQCLSPNGSVTINGTGGTPPYAFLFGTSGFGTANSFSDLREGNYNAIIKDAQDCQKTLGIVVGRQSTGVSFASQIKPIIETHCAISGCHVAGATNPNFSQLSNIQSSSSRIKTRTGNRSMPIGNGGTLSQAQIDLIACWVDDGALNN